jgi:predicted Zn finger-like uncharacterized protein
MKITCQACQSKYTIADDKIQGKVAKIRCRKCGATVLVDASTSAASNGSGAPAGAAPGAWLVNVAEGDERSMQLHEVVDAYNNGVITAETYLWKEGMGDWQTLSDIAEIVNALNQAGGGGAAAAPDQSSAKAAAQPYGGSSAYSAARSNTAARRETGRGADMFAREPIEEEVATSVPPHVLAQASSMGGVGNQVVAQRSGGMSGGMAAGMMGTRDEQSVLFSLNALTGGAKPSSPAASSMTGSPRNEDSGLIDLNALARAQQSRTTEEAQMQLAPPTPFMFPAALGTVEAPQAQSQGRSSMPLFIGGGIMVAGLAIAVAILAGGKKDEVPPMPAEAALSAAPIPTPEVPAATAAPVETAAPVDSAPAKVVRKPAGGPRPAAKGATPTTPAVATPATPLPPPKPKSPCGCAPSDLQCQIRCSATGH